MRLSRTLLAGLVLAVIAGVFVLSSPIRDASGQAAGQVQVVGPLTRDNGAIQTLTAQGAATLNSADQSGFNVTRVICVFRQSATGGTPSTTFSIQNKDAASGQYYSIITSAAITANSVNFITAGGDVTTTTNVGAGVPIARTWRTSTTVGGTTPAVTATIGCSVQ